MQALSIDRIQSTVLHAWVEETIGETSVCVQDGGLRSIWRSENCEEKCEKVVKVYVKAAIAVLNGRGTARQRAENLRPEGCDRAAISSRARGQARGRQAGEEVVEEKVSRCKLRLVRGSTLGLARLFYDSVFFLLSLLFPLIVISS